MKKFFVLLVCCALVLAGCAGGEGDVASILILPGSGGTARFTNRVQGFSVEAPEDFTLRDKLAATELRLERDDCVIEVIREDFASAGDARDYSVYSNRFLTDTENHRLEEQVDTVAAGLPARLTRWSRDSLGPGDRNHYAVTDIFDGATAYTVVVKSVKPVDGLDFSYSDVAGSLRKEKAVPLSEAGSFGGDSATVMNAETRAAFSRFFLEDGHHWGIYYHKQPVLGMEKFEALEAKTGRLELALLYTEISDEYDPALVYGGLVNAWNSGKVCEVTLQSDNDAGNDVVYDILKGRYDDFLNKYAADVAAFGHPVLLRPFNEMNGEWCNYAGFHLSRDPDLYIRLYKYVYGIFRAHNAENVVWIWNPNETSYPNYKWNAAELYYPGGELVDAVGLSGYNAGTGIPGEKWRSFREIYDGYYETMEATYNKPMMITEFGCSSIGGDKLAWVRDMFADLDRYPKLHTAVWLHDKNTDPVTGATTRSFYLDDTPGVTEVFKENLR